MLKQYTVIARSNPTQECANPPAIRVQVFAKDEVVAKSKFWNVARRIARMKKAHGEILSIQQVFEPEPTRAKTYGLWITYRTVRGVHNNYKEYRDVTTEGAVERMYQEMAGTHNVPEKEITIIKVQEVAPEDVKHKQIHQFVVDGVKFPILKQQIRPAKASDRKLLSVKRPAVCGF